MTATLTVAAAASACAFFACSTVAIAEGAVNDWRVGYRVRAAKGAAIAALDAGATLGSLWAIVAMMVR